MPASTDDQDLQQISEALGEIKQGAEQYLEQCPQVNPDIEGKGEICWDARSSLSTIHTGYATLKRVGLRDDETREKIRDRYGQGFFDAFRNIFYKGGNYFTESCRSGQCGSTPDDVRSALQIIEEIEAERPIGALDFNQGKSSLAMNYGDGTDQDYRSGDTGFHPPSAED